MSKLQLILLGHFDCLLPSGAHRVVDEIRRLDKFATSKRLVQPFSQGEARREHFRHNLEALGLV